MLSRSIIRGGTALFVLSRCAKVRGTQTVKLQCTTTLIFPGIRTFAMGSFWSSNPPSKPGNASSPEVKFSEEELKKRLTPMQYHVTQEKGTERAFSGELTYNKETGIYNCVVCGTPLFKSDHKYDSGSGWPSFYDVMNSDAVEKHTDHSHGMKRVEVTCKNCGGHLGHVFDDGPMPSNERYCINSASLKFDKSKPKSDL